MNIQKIFYFMSVARHLNFTKAAQECHIAQTAMSRHIASIEEEVGVTLFNRSSRVVSLTPAGKVFYQQGLLLVEQYSSMILKTQIAAKGMNDALRIGFGQYEHTLVTKLVTHFRRLYPEVDISVQQYSTSQLWRNVVTGLVDIIFTVPVGAEKASQNLLLHHVYSSPLSLIAHAKHPFCNFPSISANMLNGEVLITLNEDEGYFSVEILKKLLASFGAYPKNIISANSLEAQILMVECGYGVALFPDICQKHLTPNIVAIPLVDFVASDFSAAIQQNSNNTAALLFMEMLREHGKDVVTRL